MPKLGVEVREGADNVDLNTPYEVVNVEEVTTDVSAYAGIRVEFLSKAAKTGTIMLWKRPVTGTASKLGVFITALGDNTDKWLHKWVIFIGWEKGNRNIEVSAEAPRAKPKSKAAKASTSAKS